MFSQKNSYLGLALLIPIFAVLVWSQSSQKNEAKVQPSMPLEQMVKAITEQPLLVNHSFYYDDGFKAVGSYSIHDHVGKRMCMGYLVSDGNRLAYRYIRAMPGMGASNDAFETEFKNLGRVEYKFYAASSGMMDYYPERLSVHFYFKTPIVGLLAKWEKKDMKFDIWDVNFGKKMMEFIKAAGVPTTEKD